MLCAAGFSAAAPPTTLPLHGKTLVGHDDGVLAVAISPDGQLAASGSADKTARLWDLKTGKELHRFKGHAGAIVQIVFSGDGKRLATGGIDGAVRLWDVKRGELIANIKTKRPHIHSLAISFDGRRVAVGSCDGIAAVWDVDQEHLIGELKHRTGVGALALSPDGKRLLTGTGVDAPMRIGKEKEWPKGEECNLFVFDVDTGKQLHSITHDHRVSEAAFSADGKLFATATLAAEMNGTSVGVFDATTFAQVRTQWVGGGGGTHGGAGMFSGDLSRIVTEMGNEVGCWQQDRKTPIARFFGGDPSVNAAGISQDGRFAISGGGGRGSPYPGEDKEVWTKTEENVIRVWDLSVASKPGPVHIATSEIAVKNSRGPHFLAIAAPPDGSVIAMACLDGKIRLIDPVSGAQTREIFLGGKIGPVFAVAITPDARIVGGVSFGGEAKVFRTATGEEIRTAHAEKGLHVTDVALHPDGRSMFIAAVRGQKQMEVQQIELETGKVLQKFSGHHKQIVNRLYVSPDGRWLLTVSETRSREPTEICSWSVADGKFAAEVNPKRPPARSYERWAGLTFVAGKAGDLAVFGIDNIAYACNPASGAEVSRFDRERSELLAIAAAPDRKTFVAATRDGTAGVYRPDNAEPVGRGHFQTFGLLSAGVHAAVYLPDHRPAVIINNDQDTWIRPLE
jgi:WD40 repeat protein